jgi:ADP-heptose:LPS heptosyltransferase
MGDVAMTVPVIKNILQQHPGLHITFVSNAFYAPLFEGMERLRFYPAYLKDKHKGIRGLYRLFSELKKHNKFDAIVDLHNVLRSRVIRNFFKLSGYKISVMDKGRNDKKALTRKENKLLQPLRSMHERYADVFRSVGLAVDLNIAEPVFSKQLLPAFEFIFSSGKKMIGVAPFAQHTEKMYPIEKMKAVVKAIAVHNNILLFGGGKREAAILQEWEYELKNVYAIAGKFSFKEELAIISNLDLMVSMDSANMHLASLYNLPVVSIWGATHPFAGFYGWAQDEKNIVQVELYCRPCSVFGNKPCFRDDHACMKLIMEDVIIQKIKSLL